jgi:hypothetical protein
MERVRRVELPTLCLASMAGKKSLANSILANLQKNLYRFSALVAMP